MAPGPPFTRTDLARKIVNFFKTRGKNDIMSSQKPRALKTHYFQKQQQFQDDVISKIEDKGCVERR